MVQELTPEGQLLLPFYIQNFELVRTSFEIEKLSSFDVISEGFQKYLTFWACKWNHHVIPCQNLLIQANQFLLKNGEFELASTIILITRTKWLTKWDSNLQSHRAGRYFLVQGRLPGIPALRYFIYNTWQRGLAGKHFRYFSPDTRKAAF